MKREFGGAGFVAQRVGAFGEAGGVCVGEEEADAVGVVAFAGDAGAEDDAVGGVAVQDDVLGAVDDPAAVGRRAVVVTSVRS